MSKKKDYTAQRKRSNANKIKRIKKHLERNLTDPSNLKALELYENGKDRGKKT